MRIGDSCWHCKVLDNISDIEKYDKPYEIITKLRYFTIMGKSGSSEYIDLGLDEQSRLSAIAQPYRLWENVFNVGDVFYVNGNKPSEDEDFYGQLANYIVTNVDYGNARVRLILERISQ